MANFNPLSLAILCGGQARRLGTDKGLYAPLGDESLIVRALKRFAQFAADTLVVVKDEEQAQLYERAIAHQSPELVGSFRLVTDTSSPLDSHFQGSLRGVYTALSHAEFERLITLPVDQVALRPRHLDQLAKMATVGCYSTNNRKIWSFPSLWTASQLPRIEALMSAGAYSIAGALRELEAQLIRADELDEVLGVNVNTQAEAKGFFGTPLTDSYGRRMHYLRFSLTESCNMSCHYCLPEGFPEWYRHKARLSFEDISTLLAGFRRLGFRKVRFTGGEPTLHPACLESVRYAAKLGYEEICLTTNGTRLGDLKTWCEAGLTGLNISLDSLNPRTFRTMTKSSQFPEVMRAIDQACALGINLKINTVLLRSRNGTEIEDMVNWAAERPLTLRFIELMPTKLNQSFDKQERIHGYELEPILLAKGMTDKIAPGDRRGLSTRGPATVYRSSLYPGRIGLINPMSCNFCSDCNRLRLGAKGGVRLCLFADRDIEVPKESPETVERFMRSLIGQKEERHHLEDGEVGNVSTFRTIGG